MATKADNARWSRFPDLGCVACRIDGRANDQTQVHHLNLGGHAGQKRRGNEYTIPLCAWHHQAIPPQPFDRAWARQHMGPSLAEGSKAFRERYGSDDYLLARVDMLLKGDWHDHIF